MPPFENYNNKPNQKLTVSDKPSEAQRKPSIFEDASIEEIGTNPEGKIVIKRKQRISTEATTTDIMFYSSTTPGTQLHLEHTNAPRRSNELKVIPKINNRNLAEFRYDLTTGDLIAARITVHRISQPVSPFVYSLYLIVGEDGEIYPDLKDARFEVVGNVDQYPWLNDKKILLENQVPESVTGIEVSSHIKIEADWNNPEQITFKVTFPGGEVKEGYFPISIHPNSDKLINAELQNIDFPASMFSADASVDSSNLES